MPRLYSRAQDAAHAGMMIDRGWVHVHQAHGAVDGFIARSGAVIHALYVRAGARNRGIGTALLEHAKAGSATLDLWTFEANRGAQNFYARHGFAQTERTNGAGNDENLPDIQFVWHRKKDAA